MARIETRAALKWAAVAFCALWVVFTVYQEFFVVDADQFGFRSPEVVAQLKTCGGAFQQRYDCIEAIIIAKQHDSFVGWWVWAALLILGPPLGVGLLLTRLEPRGRGRDDAPWEGRRPQPINRFRLR